MSPYYIKRFVWDGNDLIITVGDMNSDEEWTKTLSASLFMTNLAGLGSKESK